jgi:FkbH-like protein
MRGIDGGEGRLAGWVSELEHRLEGTGPDALGRRLAGLLGELVESRPAEAFEFLQRCGGDEVRRIPGSTDLLGRLALRLLDDGAASALALARLAAEWRVPLDGTMGEALARARVPDGESGEVRQVLEGIVRREPTNPGALRGLYELARRESRHAAAHDLLNRLVAADPALSTATYAFRERERLDPGPGQPVRIAVLSSYVLDQLIPYLDVECRRAGLVPRLHVAPYNQYAQQILDPSSTLYQFRPEITFLALAVEDLFPAVTACPAAGELRAAGEEIRARVLGLVGKLEERSGGLIVVHDFVLGHPSPHGILDNRVDDGLARWIGELNRSLAEDLRGRARAFLLPTGEVLGWVGKARVHNAKLRHMGSMRISEAGLPSLAAWYMRYLKPLKGLTRKCIVLDLDGTLWGGVVGEVGVEGVALGPTAPGVAYREFQEALLNLTRRGILLAVCSKNNPEDALAVIRGHEHMLLREEHFGAMRINWRNKAENLREIAEELNIGLDALVFIDDNPVERDLIRQLLPEVLTPELPRDPSRYRTMLEEMSDFDLLALTREDELRTAQYQAMAKRRVTREASGSLEEYLTSLGIEVEIEPARRAEASRLVQMFAKTNQFNLTTRRYQAADVERFMSSGEYLVYALHVRDRFGDHGLVGAAVVHAEADGWRIDSLLMSCRVMGLSVETAFLARIHRDACEAGVARLTGEFIPTGKNRPVEGFYRHHGFRLARTAGDREVWERERAGDEPLETPSWISVRGVATTHAS